MHACLDGLRKALLVHGRAAISLQHRAGAADALDDLQEDGGPVAQRLGEDLQQHPLRPPQGCSAGCTWLPGSAVLSMGLAAEALCCSRESDAVYSEAQDDAKVHGEAEAGGRWQPRDEAAVKALRAPGHPCQPADRAPPPPGTAQA